MSEQVEQFCAFACLGVVDVLVTKEILESFEVKNYEVSYVVEDFGVLK